MNEAEMKRVLGKLAANRRAAELVAELFVKTVAAEHLAEEVNKVQVRVLAEHPLYDGGHLRGGATAGDRILDPRYTYFATAEDFEAWYPHVTAALLEAGLKPADMAPEKCPALVADTEKIRAEIELLDYFGRPLALKANEIEWKSRQKFLDCCVGLTLCRQREAVSALAGSALVAYCAKKG